MHTSRLAARLIERLREQQKTIATVESCTGGLIAAAITSIAGSSDVFQSGFVTYANAAKSAMVGVPEYLLASYGAVSIEVAASMAEGGLKTAGAQIALSVTGIAGPGGGTPEKPVGLVCFGLSYIDPEQEIVTYAQKMTFGDMGRDRVREKSVEHALQWALDVLEPGTNA
ncbi:CinA family protein [Asticcacaulis sp. EMRT-3]|uniref:CinA family protein n=1 Tax=Asticcacaulis sp. EMRT-3 TaxID=3040349 RepID=UPI0024AFB68C|nr:CinA family protein [Asticcacaulis sp. EMRT-3]MDI7774518.1 CinA family protein [Asticcacaulis sp. EMRT-3]